MRISPHDPKLRATKWRSVLTIENKVKVKADTEPCFNHMLYEPGEVWILSAIHPREIGTMDYFVDKSNMM